MSLNAHHDPERKQPRLQLFGHVTLIDGQGHFHKLPTRRAQSLAALLGSHGYRSIARERVAEIIFPNKPTIQSRRCLATETWRLAQTLDTAACKHWLKKSRDGIALAPDRPECVDYNILIAAHNIIMQKRGDLAETGLMEIGLHAISISDLPFASHNYANWAESIRNHVAQMRIEILEALIGAENISRNPETLLHMAQRLLEIDPYHETAMQSVIAAQSTLGRPQAARQSYQKFKTLLARDLGVRGTRLTLTGMRKTEHAVDQSTDKTARQHLSLEDIAKDLHRIAQLLDHQIRTSKDS